MNVGFNDRGIDAEAPAADHPAPAPQGDQSSKDVLEHGLVEKMRQPDQRFGVRDAFTLNAAECAIDQAPPDLSLTLIETPVEEVLENELDRTHVDLQSDGA